MTKAIFEDAFNLLCGDKLGSGVHRDVYECKLLPHMVVKVEQASFQRSFANVREHDFWVENEDRKKVAQWLAPCGQLSADGRILLQYRVDPIPLNFELPQQLPSFLNDVKRDNFGLFEGRLVSVDYSHHIEFVNTKLRRTYWG